MIYDPSKPWDEEAFRRRYPHSLRYGSTETINVGPKPLTRVAWQAQCACGYRGRVGDWHMADADRGIHEYEANTKELESNA
jgi:hypothetical protein